MTQPTQTEERHGFDEAQIGALAHMFRAEVYRSSVYRLRFDNTTNWAVVTTGIAMSASFSSAAASPLPLVFVGLLVSFFLLIEAPRYCTCRHYRLALPDSAPDVIRDNA